MRNVYLFLHTLMIWSFSHRGAELQFSALMGYASGPRTCRLGYPELAKSTVAGFQLPP